MFILLFFLHLLLSGESGESVPAALHSLMDSSVRLRQILFVHVDSELLQLPQGGAHHRVAAALLLLPPPGRRR